MDTTVPGGTWVQRSILADQVYKEILARLMDGKLKSGDPISIDGTARALGVSPTPVREALARLESTNMVVRAALRGYRVAPLLTHEELLDLMDARLLIEPYNAELACGRADATFLESLERSIDDLREAPNGPPRAPPDRADVMPVVIVDLFHQDLESNAKTSSPVCLAARQVSD